MNSNDNICYLVQSIKNRIDKIPDHYVYIGPVRRDVERLCKLVFGSEEPEPDNENKERTV